MKFNKILEFWFNLDVKIRFLIAGSYNTAFGYILFCLLQFKFKDSLHYLIILVIGHIISVFNSFVTLKYLVFNSKQSFIKEYFKVNIVYLGYLILNAFFLYILKDLLKVNIYIAQFICIITLVGASYLSHKYFSFKQ
jgi:putative flippase GtrA